MAQPNDQPALLWFTRDLRLHDQPAVQAAAASGRPVVACFVLDDAAGGAWAVGGASRWWLHHSLAALGTTLTKAGTNLILRRGNAAVEIQRLAAEIGAAELHVGHQPEPQGRAVLKALEPRLAQAGCVLHRHWTTLLFDPATVTTKGAGAFLVFTPFSKACLARGVPPDLQPAHTRLHAGPPAPTDRLDDWALLPTHPDWAAGLRESWTPGEAGAAAALRAFITDGVENYARARDVPGQNGVSRLSPHLHFGEVSAAQAWRAAAAHPGKGAQTFINEVLWREFSAHLLWAHPTLPDEPLRPQFATMRWRRDAAGLRAWQRGRTGIPIVDAGMRQLWHTGWQHNRVRMITASFLIKHLLIDWREGEKWFWDTLVDADLASNSQNWQWVAGCGADAAPFFRIFNPWLQAKKFDPEGIYVKSWVPELAGLDAADIHAPWDAPPAILAAAGVVLGKTYPAPIVDLAVGRNRALAAFADVTDKVMH